MKSITLLIALLCWLFCQSAHAQTSAPQQALNSEADEEFLESEEVDVDGDNTPMLYTMTSGTFETGGRVLIASPSSAVSSLLNQDQAEKSGLKAEPVEYALHQNYPNPFNPITTIHFDLPEQAFVTLKVFNVLGQEVVSLLDNDLLDAGNQEVELNAHDLSSGVYFYRIAASGIDEDGVNTSIFNSVKKMLLLR